MTTNLVTVYAPAQFVVEGEVGNLTPTSMARLEMARADWLARSINEFIAKFDRSSNRDHEKLVSMLIGHEMYLRGAARSGESGLGAGRAEEERAGRGAVWIQAARAARVEAVRKAGLEEDLATVNRYLGEENANLTRALAGVPAPYASDRIRTLGRPFPLMGLLPGIDEPPSKNSLVLQSQGWENRANPAQGRAIIALLVIMTLALVTTAWRGGARTTSVALLLALGLAGFMGGLLALAGALGLAAAAWSKARGGTFA
jgi:hypothetical protein